MRHLAIPALVLACLALQPARASACSALACPVRGRVVPEDGATGVPTNTEIHVVYSTRCGYGGVCASAADVRLRELETATEIALAPAARPERLRPVTELAPRATYEILDRDWSSLDCNDSLEPVVIGRFTTGDGPDLVPPSSPTGLVSGACSYDHCDSSSCCGPYEATSTTVTWEPAEDDGPSAVGYVAAGRVVYGNGVHLYTFSSPYPGAFYPRGGMIRSGSGPISVIAIDLAGNESAPSESAPVNLGCYPRPDGGLADAGSPDGGTARDASTPRSDASTVRDASAPDAGLATRSASTCGVTHARPSGPVWLLGLTVVALWSRTRRRSARPLRRHAAS